MILVTGATGNVGRQVVSQLAAAGAAVRALTTRDPDSAGLPDGVDVVRGDLSVADTLQAGLDGVEAVFLVWPLLTTHDVPAFLTAVKAQASRIVYLSSAGVRDDVEEQADPINQSHGEIERLIERSGLRWTVLRSGGMATNTLMWAEQIRTGGVVRWPYGAASRPLIHEADIAAVAVRALTADGHDGAKHVLTGPQVLTQTEQVHTIGEAIGRPLRFEEISREVAREGLLEAWGDPSMVDGALDAWAGMVTEPEEGTGTVQEITERPARTFHEWAIDHAADFAAGGGVQR